MRDAVAEIKGRDHHYTFGPIVSGPEQGTRRKEHTPTQQHMGEGLCEQMARVQLNIRAENREKTTPDQPKPLRENQTKPNQPNVESELPHKTHTIRRSALALDI